MVRPLGVSNFNEEQLSYLLSHARINPVLNQFLSYPGKANQTLIDFCKHHHIIPEAYQSIKKVSEKTKQFLNPMASSYKKTWSQIVLNYQIDQGLVVIPKSHKSNHQYENMDVFDFTLTLAITAIIKNLDDSK